MGGESEFCPVSVNSILSIHERKHPAMFKAIIRRTFLIGTALTFFLLAACSNPEEERAEALEEAVELHATGASEEAIAVLEDLSTKFPNDPEILGQLGLIYMDQDDPTMAAFFLEQAYRLQPENTDLLVQAFKAQDAADQPEAAEETLATLAQEAPDKMTRDHWLRLGQAKSASGDTQDAIDAYREAVGPDDSAADPKTAAKLGELYQRSDNEEQAEHWFSIAAQGDGPHALSALLRLLDREIAEENWEEAEALIARMDEKFPDEPQDSELADARELVAEKRAARASEERDAEADSEEEEAAASSEESSTAGRAQAAAGDAEADEPGEAGMGKTEAVEELEKARAMAQTPATGADEPVRDKNKQAEAASFEPGDASFNPDVPVKPAPPDPGIAVSFDQQETGAGINYSINSGNDAEAADEERPDPDRQARPALDVDALLDHAATAERNLDYERAIRIYWQAIRQANDRAGVWARLSNAYLAAGQPRNAQTAAIKAVRHAPENVHYTLDYLRIVQRVAPPSTFLNEIKSAYERIPDSPEITLALARAYDRIEANRSEARDFYRRFIDLAPDHPLRPEAEAALQRLR